MPWNPAQIDSQILAVHAALVPNGPQGEVVLFGGDEHWGAQQESAGDDSWKKTRVYDVATHSIVAGQTQSPDSDVFCAHHAFIGDGRLLIAGGTSKWPEDTDDHDHGLDFLGHSRCWLYNPRQRQWVETTRLNRNADQPDVERSGGRWYPGLTSLGDGSVIAFFGHLDQDDFRHRNNTPERFFPSGRNWVDLPNIIGNYGKPNEGGRRYLFFPRAFVLPSGKVFSATPLPTDFATQMGGSDGPHFSTAFDVGTGLYTTPRANAADGVDTAWSFPAVLLPLLPNAGQYNARLLFWNGATPRWIDTDAASPQWTNTPARDPAVATRQRKYGQMVLLPTGQVCAIGGMHVVNPEDPVNQAEIYTPDINWATNSYGAGGGAWALDTANSAINNRNYHSTALLLPNGKIWVAGGNLNGNPGNPATVGIRQIELYEPPYIAVANRIAIQTAPGLLAYGQQFDVVLDRAATNVGRVALIRNSSVTHSTDTDQRYVGLEIVSRSGNTIRLAAPPTGHVAPPGYYMLWIVDNAGDPCRLARFVRVAHLSCRVIADRSTFSEEEVDALGDGSNANFGSALYVDFDGFIASELSGTPAFTLEYSGGGPVLASDVTLQFAGRFTETNPPSPDVPTRITYAFDVIFPTMGAFSGWPDNRDIVVRFTLGAHSCQTSLRLTKSPNPYMTDIDPAEHNPAWLSTDVRVFKVRPNQTKFGATLSSAGNGPWTYIRAVIDRLRSGAESFTSIDASGPETTLDGAYMSGVPALPTFNFAIAKVRYRATVTTATDVRCFFRMCNAAATGLGFGETVYPSTPGPNPVPLLGVAGGQVVSIPFVNQPRVNTVTGQSGATGLNSQTLDPNYDIQDIVPQNTGAEVTAYFGCYLDINTPTKRFPAAPMGNGPFAEADSLPIRDLLRSWHNCIVAEIVFAGDPTPPNVGPSDSDNLAQRNLAIVGLENPGLSASRTAMHTLEIAPSRLEKGELIFLPTQPEAEGTAGFVAGHTRRSHPDELFFDWRGLPADTEVTLYFSDVDTAEIGALLAGRISPAAFTALDRHTIRFRIGDCAWLPLPGGREVRIPALISIALPEGIVEGQVYRVSVRQVEGRTGRIVGSVTIEMPVSKAAFLRPEAERQLSYMGHIARILPAGDRWRPLIERLVAHLASRVDALGGNSSTVEPNPDGTGKPYRPSAWQPGQPFPDGGFHSGDGTGTGTGAQDEDCIPWAGWGIAAALALALVALGALPAAGLPLVVLAMLAIALFGYVWARKCKGRFLCRLLDKLILGAVTAAGVLALGAVFYGAPVHPGSLALSSVIALTAIIASYLLRCRKGCCD